MHRISLLEELRKGGFEASLVTTYNAYLPFYEEVVLRRMVNAGIHHNVLLMDASQYSLSLKSDPPRLAGRQYSLLPMTVPGAFHPKLIFLAGKSKGLLLIGSHNMTIAGFGFNRELTGAVRIGGDHDDSGVAIAHATLAAVDHWLEHFTPGLPAHTREMVRRVRDFAPWLKNESVPGSDFRLLVGHPGGISLWQQFRHLWDGDAESVSINGAFFDRNLDFLTRVKLDLPTAQMTVAIDPATVQIEQDARFLSDVSFVNAARLGAEKEGDPAGYLHAKSIYVEGGSGKRLFAVGSANPSRPAWLAPENGSSNVEIMLAYLGDAARVAAKATGLDAMRDLPPIDDAGWKEVAQAQENGPEPVAGGPRTGVAVAYNREIGFDQCLCPATDGAEFVLCEWNGAEIARTSKSRIEGTSIIVEFAETVTAAAFLNGYVNGLLSLHLLIHHSALVEEQARTGNQRNLKHALQSLDTDTPNIDLLVHCLDKIVFGDDPPSQASDTRKTYGSQPPKDNDPEDKGTLAIRVDEMRKRGGKKRLHHSSDFGYLLDALIYHLRIREDKPPENGDRFGRNEEEQVGADDEQLPDDAPLSPEKQAEILDICHSKVRTIIKRITAQLNASAEGKQPFSAVVVRLLGVLAVLRELRRCDGKVAWVEKGNTTVPQDQRQNLLEAVMFTLFERNAEGLSLLDLWEVEDEFQSSDDVARLKGLVLWLAWDSGLMLDLHKPFMENPADLQKRLERNAMVLALAQMIRRDEIVVDEARQSIGSLTSSEMNWLEAIQTLAAQCDDLLDNPDYNLPAQKAEPGDIAIHRTLRPWNLRVVRSHNSKQMSLIRLSADGRPISYRSEHLSVGPFSR